MVNPHRFHWESQPLIDYKLMTAPSRDDSLSMKRSCAWHPFDLLDLEFQLSAHQGIVSKHSFLPVSQPRLLLSMEEEANLSSLKWDSLVGSAQKV